MMLNSPSRSGLFAWGKHILLLTVLVMLLSPDTGSAFVHASGDSIVDASGNVVLKQGMGLGGWLVPEGYMLQFPGQGSPTAIRNMIVDLIGESAADSFYTRYRQNYVTPGDIQQLADWGFDHIRLPFHYRQLSPYRGVWDSSGFALMDTVLGWCRDAGMYLILDMHCAPGAQNGGPISDSDGTARLWLADSNKAHAIDIWYTLAEHFADEEWIAGYDLLNEPVLPNGIPATQMRALYMDMTTAIRQVDPNHLLFIEGNWYATDFTSLTPPWDMNLAYSFHKYWSVNNQGSIQGYLNIRSAYDVPLWMSESGENSNSWFFDCRSLLETNQIGWCWWTHKKFETITSPWSADLPPGFSQLQDYWNGAGPRPPQAVAVQTLMQFATNLRTDLCTYRPGVIPALFSPAFGTNSTPFGDATLPTTIQAVDYDIGTQGLAYLDEDYENPAWDDYTPWNRGYAYRNDGVDIGMDGTQPYVGWTENGEWIQYTLSASLDGVYDLEIEVASPAAGGFLRLFLDDEALGDPQPVPATGGWTDWQSIQLSNLIIPAGSHTLRVEIVNSGFNLLAYHFILNTAATDSLFPRQFLLRPNYPNPFNAGTIFPIELQNVSTVELEIFDLQGRSCYQEGIMLNGQTSLEVFWDGRNREGRVLSSGVYLVAVRAGGKSQFAKATLLH